MKFSAMKLHPSLLRAIDDLGFEALMPIQKDAIPPALRGRDVLACAMTGSGKTAAFILPILHRLLASRRRGSVRALVLTPTRELAVQVCDHTRQLAAHTDLSAAAVFGGVPMGPQQQTLARGVEVLVATPGRLLDHLDHGHVWFDELEALVLDEADRMLDMGFLPEVERVLDFLPSERQSLLFSATMPAPIAVLAERMLDRPRKINLERLQAPPEGIRQAAFPVPEHLKRALLLHILEHEEVRSLLIFTRTKHRVNRLTQFLRKSDVTCDRLHGNRTQAQRLAAMKAFKDGSNRVLVATNLAARGIDVVHLSHVLSFDVPTVPEDYIHRIGRTARADLTGDALTFFSAEEEPLILEIEKALGHELPKITLPDFDYGRATAEEPTPARATEGRDARADKRRQGHASERREARAPSAATPDAARGGRGRRAKRRKAGRRRSGATPSTDGARERGREKSNDRRRRRRRKPGASDPRASERRTTAAAGNDAQSLPGRFQHRPDGQPTIPPEYDLPERQETPRPKRSHQPAALADDGRRFLVEDDADRPE